MLHIFGHTNPDTDAICSAVIAADLYNQLGIDAKAFRLGEPNNETKYVFEKAGVEMPSFLGHIQANSDVVLVDHNSSNQSHPALADHTIKGCIDHHMVENMNTSFPTFMRFEPLCSTCSILYEMYKEKGIAIPESIAKLILAGILSDSLAFRSPTTTVRDEEIAEELAKQLGIADLQEYALGMFEAKSDLGDIAIRDLVTLDYKEFEMGGKKIGYGVIETTNPEYSLGRKMELLEDLEKLKKEDGLAYAFLSIVDILRETNTTLVIGHDEAGVLKDVFGSDTHDNMADLGDRVSRKKQLIPQLKDYFEGK